MANSAILSDSLSQSNSAFDARAHLTQLKGKDYLEVKWRIAWFRSENPKGKIVTETVNIEPLILKATILTEAGEILATGHGTAAVKPGAVWSGREIEKAETAAIGRALGHAGYGTQFTEEDESDNIVDSPVAFNRPSPPPQQSRPASVNGAGVVHPPTNPALSEMPQIGTVNMTALLNETLSGKLVRTRAEFIALINQLKDAGDIRDAMDTSAVMGAIKAHKLQAQAVLS